MHCTTDFCMRHYVGFSQIGSQLCGEINALIVFIEKPWKLPKEHARDDSHMHVLPTDKRSETSRMECLSSAESSCTEENDPSIEVKTENPNLKMGN